MGLLSQHALGQELYEAMGEAERSALMQLCDEDRLAFLALSPEERSIRMTALLGMRAQAADALPISAMLEVGQGRMLVGGLDAGALNELRLRQLKQQEHMEALQQQRRDEARAGVFAGCGASSSEVEEECSRRGGTDALGELGACSDVHSRWC